MSKAFTKDDDAASEPLLVPPRAPLPDGVPNYVTARGLQLLRAEHGELEAERARLETAPANEDETAADGVARRRALALLQARLAELDARLRSAVRVETSTQPPEQVRFGAAVTVRGESGPDRTYTIVGVDEARLGVERGRIAFTAPLARALLGKRVHELCTVHTPRGPEELEIVAIVYPAASEPGESGEPGEPPE